MAAGRKAKPDHGTRRTWMMQMQRRTHCRGSRSNKTPGSGANKTPGGGANKTPGSGANKTPGTGNGANKMAETGRGATMTSGGGTTPGHGATTTVRTELSRILVRNRKSITAGGGGGRRDAESANPTLTPEQQADAAMGDVGPPKPTNTGAVGTSQSRRSKRASRPPKRLLDEPYGPE